MKIAIGLISVAVLCTLISLKWLDIPTASYCLRFVHDLNRIGDHLGSAVLVAGEVAVAGSLAIYRVTAGRLPPICKLAVIGCAASLASFAFNEVVLKAFFGMPGPASVLGHTATHQFHFLRGSWDSSFPSGHMTLAAAFTGTFYRYKGPVFWALVAATFTAAGLLILGDWHFLSDVFAGLLVGGSAGVLAASLWSEHSAKRDIAQNLPS